MVVGVVAEQSRGWDDNRFWQEQSIWLVHLWKLRCDVMRTFTFLGKGYISVRWLDLVLTILYLYVEQGRIEGWRCVPVRNHPPVRGRGEDR